MNNKYSIPQNFGPIGPLGDTGMMGPTGRRGAIGSIGIQGTRGFQGDTGIRGFTGMTGNTGSTGMTGSRGVQGDTGPIGFTGITGITGDRGIISNITNNSLTLLNNTILWKLPNFIDDITAKNNGVPIFGLYRTNDIIKIRLNDTPPILTLKGLTGYSLDFGNSFSEPGINALDYSNTQLSTYLYQITNSSNNNVLSSEILLDSINNTIITDTINYAKDTYTLKYYAIDDCGITGYINRNLRII